MAFPESKRVVYQNNPLVEVICQLRFPTILEIGSEDPAAFQKRIRGEYPLYSKDEPSVVVPKEMSDLLAQFHMLKPTQALHHKFLTEDSKRFVSLTSQFLAISETQYHRWEHFREEIKRAQAALEEVYRPAFYSRIGLRYQDTINKAKLDLGDESWDSLVNPSLIGALGAKEISASVQEIVTVALIKVDEVPGGFVRLQHGLIKRSPDGNQEYLIDADFFTAERRASEDVRGVLDKFNRLAGNLFRWAITPRLHSALQPLDIG